MIFAFENYFSFPVDTGAVSVILVGVLGRILFNQEDTYNEKNLDFLEKVQIEDEYQEDPREALIRRLIEYKRYKDVLDEIQEKYEKRQSMLIKPSNNMEEYVIDTSTMIPKGLEVYDLMKAMQKMYQRKMLSRPLDTHISKKDISIEQRSDQIRNYFKVRVNKRVKLDELFDRGDRYYFIVTFLSILVLANDKEVEIIQEGLFDDIYVEGKE